MPASAAAAPVLPIVEVFHSVQGEGTRVGEPSTFVRLAGCNLRCTWCDTPYSWSAEGVRSASRVTLDDLAAQVRERALVVTGGEPMLHHKRLVPWLDRLRELNAVDHVTVETNATIFDEELLGRVDLWSLSPKLPGSGEQVDRATVRRFIEHARDRMQLKFVLASLPGDYEAMWHELEACDVPADVPVIVQPDGLRDDYDAALRELSDMVVGDETLIDGVPRRSRVRVIPQTHRVAWGPAARGV